jgi:tetratricopeptide (TPR) repeat protein
VLRKIGNGVALVLLSCSPAEREPVGPMLFPGIPSAATPPAPGPVLSLLGRELAPPPVSEERRAELETKLAGWKARVASPDPGEDDFVWYGRTLAYLHRYHEAQAAFTDGLARFPESHKLLRHRGHRWITIRRLDEARQDLERAAALIDRDRRPDEVEPDGAPNARGVPRSTSHSNVWYHLALVRFLRAEWEPAAAAWRRCLEWSRNDDTLVAATHWLWSSLRRAGRDQEARRALEAIRPRMEIFENDAYHQLCLLYRGDLGPEGVLRGDVADGAQIAAAGFGVAHWHLCEGRREEALKLLRRLSENPMWPAFGVIAAEAELARAR